MRQGWIYHAAAAVILLITGLWTASGPKFSASLMGLRAFGYGSLVLLCLALIMGPLARLWPTVFGRVLPGRRAAGIWSAMAAVVHLLYVLQFLKTPLTKLFTRPDFGQAPHMGPIYDQVTIVSLFGLGALVILAVIALVSNDPAQRWLGPSSWKLVQQQAYTAFALVAGHLLVMRFGGKLKGTLPLLRWAPWLLVAVVMLQIAGFLHTVWKRRKARTGGAAA